MLVGKEIKELIEEKGLIKGFPHLKTQISLNAFDLTAGQVFKLRGKGCQDFSDSEQVIPRGTEIKPEKKNKEDKYGWWKLKRKAYKIKTNEKINLPNNLTAKVFPRASITKMGAFIPPAIIHLEYNGGLELLLVVENKNGIELKENARIAQIAFEKQ